MEHYLKVKSTQTDYYSYVIYDVQTSRIDKTVALCQTFTVCRFEVTKFLRGPTKLTKLNNKNCGITSVQKCRIISALSAVSMAAKGREDLHGLDPTVRVKLNLTEQDDHIAQAKL